MLRGLNSGEVFLLAPIGRRFFAEAGEVGIFNASGFEESIGQMIEVGIGVVYVLEDESGVYGAIGGAKIQDIYTGNLIAMELFWYMDSEKRGEGMTLLSAFERWAKGQGCTKIRMVHLSDLMPDTLRIVYERRGYREVETTYERAI